MKLSALAFGAMRLPVVDGKFDHIDEAEAGRMVAAAMAGGVDYYDTAYGYHDGQSEVVMGKLLAAYPRQDFYLADKFPGYDPSNIQKDKLAPIFEEQLRRTGAGYFDFYLLHNVCEPNIERYLDPANGVMEFMRAQKAAGRIRHLGFSLHGEYPVLERLLQAFGSEMEFAQVQLNYLDWSFQGAAQKLELLARYDIPIWVMEPLRGGALASLQPEDAATLEALRPGVSPVEWAFRYVQGVPGVRTILSGMSNLQQVQDNLAIFDHEAPLNAGERASLSRVAAGMTARIGVPCTACRYCVEYCTQGLDIPRLLALYNQRLSTKEDFIADMALSALPKDQWPTACIACRTCEDVCPQQIKIADAMASFSALLTKNN
jgi:predicted aldo/keto reductase-like oxidoreductase